MIGSQSADTAEMKRLKEEKELKKNKKVGERDNKVPGGKEVSIHHLQ